MIDSKKLAELRAIAEAATDGAWRQVGSSAKTLVGVHGNEVKIYHARKDPVLLEETWERQCSDATHIAAFDPPTVIAMLDELDRLKGNLDMEELYGEEKSEVMDEQVDIINSQDTELARLKSQLEQEGRANLMRIENDARVIERLRDVLFRLGRGCDVRKVAKDWPALEGIIQQAIEMGEL